MWCVRRCGDVRRRLEIRSCLIELIEKENKMPLRKQMLHLNSLLIVLIALTACTPAETRVTSTVARTPPTATVLIATALPVPTATITTTVLVGKFVSQSNPESYFIFTEGGRWTHWRGTERGATGLYRIEGDTFIQTTNNQGCLVPMSYKYSFDGKLLTFQLTAESQKDFC